MKNFVISALCFLALTTAHIANATSINDRQNNQRDRIVHGIKNKELTARETNKLLKNQAHIARTEARFKADGQFTKKERATIQHKQNKASARIFRQKHDRADRN